MTMSSEERLLVLRDKAARETIDLPSDVADYLAEHYESVQSLKSGLINVAAYAQRRQLPISLELARFVVEGLRPAEGIDSFPDGSNEDEKPEVPEAPAASSTLPFVSEVPQSEEPSGFVELEEFSAEPHFGSVPLATTPAPTGHNTTQAGRASSARRADDLGEQPDLFAGVDEETLAMPAVIPPIAPRDDPAAVEPVAPATENGSTAERAHNFRTAQTIPTSAATSQSVSAPTPTQAQSVPGSPLPKGSEVYFAPVRSERKRSMLDRIKIALTRAGMEQIVHEGDKVALKVHFGERGNTAFVNPIYVREVVRYVKELGGKPFVTDANTLYSGMRTNAIDHIQCALENGFSYATIGAPIIIADGLDSHDATEVAIQGKHFESVKIGSAAIQADAMVVISHVKGHEAAGFGGALKNVGMGLGCRSAKQRMHSGVKPKVNFDKCINCGQCIDWCPQHCITTKTFSSGKRSSFIDRQACIGCGECAAACAYGAIDINWEHSPNDFLERIVEHAAGALKNKKDKTIYLSFMTNITPDCDCWVMSDAPVVGDIGVLASRDIVAIDQAAYDLITQAPGVAGSRGEGLAAGEDKFLAITHINGQHAMVYAKEMGLGERKYDLKRVG